MSKAFHLTFKDAVLGGAYRLIRDVLFLIVLASLVLSVLLVFAREGAWASIAFGVLTFSFILRCHACALQKGHQEMLAKVAHERNQEYYRRYGLCAKTPDMQEVHCPTWAFLFSNWVDGEEQALLADDIVLRKDFFYYIWRGNKIVAIGHNSLPYPAPVIRGSGM